MQLHHSEAVGRNYEDENVTRRMLPHCAIANRARAVDSRKHLVVGPESV
jgi:hypothetical protein